MNQPTKPPSLPIEVLRLFYLAQEKQISGQLEINFMMGKCLVDRIKFRCDAEKLLTALQNPDTPKAT